MNRWQKMYEEKLTTAEEAMKLINNGDQIVAPLGNGTPRGLGNALAELVKTGDYRDTRYFSGFNYNCPNLCTKEVMEKFHYEDGYSTPISRALTADAVGDFHPIKLSDCPRLIGDERKFNVVMMTVSPMDEHGFFSTGVFVDFAYPVAKRDYPKKIIVEVNKNYPKTHGNNHLHISEIDALIENDWKLFAVPAAAPNDKDKAIAALIAEQIPDEACIQLGIGGIPNAVGKMLESKKDLSVHSEIICDAMLDLYNKGVITSKKKTFMPNKWICTFIVGSQDLYDFVADNPLVESHPTDWVNDPRVIGLNDNLMSINSVLEIDLAGQCISESIGYSPYTGIGGQEDFVTGAWYSKGGKSFLTTYSTYRDKEGNLQSKIVPTVNGFVGISRWNSQYLVTEYGIAYIKGKTMSDRVKAVINIAHPDFRDWLLSEAKRMRFC